MKFNENSLKAAALTIIPNAEDFNQASLIKVLAAAISIEAAAAGCPLNAEMQSNLQSLLAIKGFGCNASQFRRFLYGKQGPKAEATKPKHGDPNANIKAPSFPPQPIARNSFVTLERCHKPMIRKSDDNGLDREKFCKESV